MIQKNFFAMLGAPLANSRWSWGAVRPADGAVVLRVWQDPDNVRTHSGREFVRIWKERAGSTGPISHGSRERLEHVNLIRGGAPCYLIMCEAVDPGARPRQVRRFNDREVFPGGAVELIDDGWWVERLPGRPVADIVASGKVRR